MTALHIRIVGRDLPGRTSRTDFERTNIAVGVQRAKEVIDLTPGDAPTAEFNVEIEVSPARSGETDFKGPYAHGKLGDRFLYLSWGGVVAGSGFHMFRRAKLPLGSIPPALLSAALGQARTLELHMPFTDKKGDPICATVKPPVLEWRLGEAAST